MASTSLLDAFGLDLSGSLTPDARISQILPQFSHLQRVPLNELQLAGAGTNLTFSQPVVLPGPGLSLAVGVGIGGCFKVFTAGDHVVDSDDPFSSIAIAQDEVYIQVTLQLSVTAGVTAPISYLAFGLSTERELTVTVYRRFLRSDSGAFPEFGAAMAQTLHSFVLPQSREGLESLDDSTILVVGGTGQLKLSATFGIESPVRQLAATSPVAGKVVAVNASASFTAGLSTTLEGGHQSRLRRLKSQALEIGIYKLQSSTLAVQVSAEAGIAANAGGFDLAEKFVGALSRNPVADLQEFRRALPGEDPVARDLQIAGFEKNLGAAVCTTIGANLTDSFSVLRSNEAVLMFELAPETTSSAATTSALTSALRGDFTPFTQGASLPPGVTQTANIFTKTELSKHKITFNLLGIVNFLNVAKLARISEVKRNPNGEITVVTDTADANRLQAVLLNTAGNPKRLHSMLSEDFLFQTTFKVSDLNVLPAEFSAKHTFIEISNKTDHCRMKELLNVCQALGLISGEQEAARLKGDGVFGRTSFWLQTTYSEAAVERTFLTPAGTARTQEEFELLGRQALGQLLAGDDGQEFRKQVADLGPSGNRIWAGLKETGAAAKFNAVFGLPLDVVDPRVNAAGADYLCITSWATAMTRLADTIVKTKDFLRQAGHIDDARLTALREQLKDRMADVVSHSGEHFGEPLGLLMVYLASAHAAGARVIVTGDSIQPLTSTITPNGHSSPAIA